MEFTNRQTYLTAVAQWKLEYAQTSEAIRNNRKQFVEAQRAFSKTSPQDRAEYRAAYFAMLAVHRERLSLRAIANAAILERHEGKVEAQRQYEMEHAAVA